MNNLFDSILRTGYVIIYVDDILIFTPAMESHVTLVKQVLACLHHNQLSLKPSKCDFHKDTVEYLGRLISKGAVTIKPSHIITIKNWPTPTTKVVLQRIIGLANLLQEIHLKYSMLIEPLSLLTGNTTYIWTKEQDEALQKLQEALTSNPVLKLPDLVNPFRIFSDASLVASGALLKQQQDSKWLPIAFSSKMFSAPECKYPMHD